MSNISFDEGDTTMRAAPVAAQRPALVKLMIRWGFANDQKGAEMVLIGTAVVAFVLAIIIPFVSGGRNVPPPQVVPLNPTLP
jgi:hypothetical protein